MPDPLPGLGRVRRRIGPTRRQLDVTLGAWKRAGILAGDDHAVVRAALRDAAEACDAARDAMRAGEGSAFTLTTTAGRLFDMVAAVRPFVVSGGESDGLDAFLATLAAPAVRDPDRS